MSVALHIRVSIHDMIVFLVCKCEMMTYPDAFFIFSKFWFFGLLGGGRKGGGLQKMVQNDKKILSHSISQEPYTSYDCGFRCTCLKWYLQHFFFFSFFKILIFRVFQSSPINAKRKFWGVPHLLHMCIILSFNLTFKKIIHPRVSVSSNVTSLFGIKFENVFIIVSLKTEVFQGIPQKCTAVVVNIFKDVHYNSRTWQSFGGEKYEHLKANRAIQK